MWYAAQVYTGMENSICLQAQRIIPKEILQQAFVLYREEKRHVNQEWITLQKVLFPGYIFVITDHVDELYTHLKHVIGMSRLLGIGGEIVPLAEAEVSLLKKFSEEGRLVKMSEGIIENDVVRIVSGPLVGMEGNIRKINRHKRKAWIEIQMFGRTQMVQIGLEIVEKRESGAD